MEKPNRFPNDLRQTNQKLNNCPAMGDMENCRMNTNKAIMDGFSRAFSDVGVRLSQANTELVSNFFITLFQLTLFFAGGYVMTETVRWLGSDIIAMFGQNPPEWGFWAVGFAIWCTVYGIYFYEHCFVWVNPGKVVIVAGGIFDLTKTPISEKEVTGTLNKLDAYRELGMGLWGKKIGEKVVAAFNVDAQIICDEMVTVPDMNQIPCIVKYQLRLVGLRGWLFKLKLIGEAAAKKYFQGQVMAAIQSKFAHNDGEKVRKDLEAFSKEFGELFGGDDKVDPREKQYGLITRNLVIEFIGVPDKILDSKVRISVNKNVAKSMEPLIKMGVTPDLAFAQVSGTSVELIQATIGGGGGRGKGKKGKGRGGDPNLHAGVNVV